MNLVQGGIAIGLGVGLTAVCPPAGVGLVALGTGTALIGFGQAVEATGHEDPVRNFANKLGMSNKAYDTASEAIPFLTSLGCMGATSVLTNSALRNGASTAVDAVDTVANMSEHAMQAEEKVISYETDVYSVYTKGSYNKAPKLNYGPLARDAAGDNRGAALKGVSNPESKQLVNGPYIKNGKPNGRPTSSGKKKLQFERDVYNDNVDLDGILRDPNTGEVIDWKPGQPRRGVVDFGHKSGYSYKEMFNKYKNREITLDELKDFQTNPDNYRLETPSANRSHKFE